MTIHVNTQLDFLDCDGNCLNDADGDGVCNELEIAGCTDPNSDSYMPQATDEDGSCITSDVQ